MSRVRPTAWLSLWWFALGIPRARRMPRHVKVPCPDMVHRCMWGCFQVPTNGFRRFVKQIADVAGHSKSKASQPGKEGTRGTIDGMSRENIAFALVSFFQ